MLRIDYGRGDERSHFVRDVDDGRHLLCLHVHLEDLALVGAHVDQRRRILHHRRDDTVGNGHVDDGTVESGFRDRPKLFGDAPTLARTRMAPRSSPVSTYRLPVKMRPATIGATFHATRISTCFLAIHTIDRRDQRHFVYVF